MKIFIADLSKIINIQNFFNQNLEVLSFSERERFDRIALPLKKLQFLMGRLLVKKLLSDSIVVDKNGKPFLSSNSKYISLSHSDNYVVLCVADDEVGIDIENCTKNRNFKGLSDYLKFEKCDDAITFYKQFTKFEAEYKLNPSLKKELPFVKFFKIDNFIMCVVSQSDSDVSILSVGVDFTTFGLELEEVL